MPRRTRHRRIATDLFSSAAINMLKPALRIFGIALVVSGLLWTLQGLGILMWPSQSFMLAQREWALYGGITAGIGAVIVVLSGRIGPQK